MSAFNTSEDVAAGPKPVNKTLHLIISHRGKLATILLLMLM